MSAPASSAPSSSSCWEVVNYHRDKNRNNPSSYNSPSAVYQHTQRGNNQTSGFNSLLKPAASFSSQASTLTNSLNWRAKPWKPASLAKSEVRNVAATATSAHQANLSTWSQQKKPLLEMRATAVSTKSPEELMSQLSLRSQTQSSLAPAAKSAASSSSSLEVLTLAASHAASSKPSLKVKGRTHTVSNVHSDDIHCLLKLPDQTFISGSKDGSLKKWDFEGKLIKNVYLPEKSNYCSWITALSSFGQEYWLSGTRDSYLDLWDVEGNHRAELKTFPESSGHKCKERNLKRITCLSDFDSLGGSSQYFAGWPTQFTTQKCTENTHQRINYTITDQNDWVYCVHPLTLNSLLVVTGTRLDYYTRDKQGSGPWSPTRLIQEADHFAHYNEQRQRAYISSVTAMSSNPAHFGLTIFNGCIQIFDTEQRKVVMEAREHENRVWTIVNTEAHCFASCADDGLIKLWDIRAPSKSTATFKDNIRHKARVSVLLNSDSHKLISGSCPDDLYRQAEKAQFSFWDLRQI